MVTECKYTSNQLVSLNRNNPQQLNRCEMIPLLVLRWFLMTWFVNLVQLVS